MSEIYRELAERFAATALPASVCADPCAAQTFEQRTGPRFGTNLLTVAEAEQMLRAVLAGYTVAREAPAAAPDAPQTFGEKAVGLSFNPSNDSAVDRVKRLYAKAIDEMHDLLTGAPDDIVPHGSEEKLHLARIAITEAQGAQMRAVKALTWRD